MKSITVITAAALLTGCATSGVMERADGTFAINSWNQGGIIGGGVAGAQERAFDAAQAHCQKSGLRAALIDATGMQQDGAFAVSNAQYNRSGKRASASASGIAANAIGPGQATVTFICK